MVMIVHPIPLDGKDVGYVGGKGEQGRGREEEEMGREERSTGQCQRQKQTLLVHCTLYCNLTGVADEYPCSVVDAGVEVGLQGGDVLCQLDLPMKECASVQEPCGWICG